MGEEGVGGCLGKEEEGVVEGGRGEWRGGKGREGGVTLSINLNTTISSEIMKIMTPDFP